MTEHDKHPPCADFDPNAPMAGTADPADDLILVEYRGVWTDRVVTQAVLPPRLRRWLDRVVSEQAERGRRAKVLFVKQSGTVTDGDHHLFIASEQRSGVLRLPVLAAISELSFDAVCERLEPLEGAHYFVCSNGQRDLCCARLGLPLYRALRDRVGERTWQISHVGGHRFAPNVLVLPSGALYGRVHPGEVDQWLTLTEADALDFAHLRGRCWLGKPEQAAEVHIADGPRRAVAIEVDGPCSIVRYADTSVTVEPGPERVVVPSCGKLPEPVLPLRVTAVD